MARARAWCAFAAVALGVVLSHTLSTHAGPVRDLLGDTPLSAVLFSFAGLAASLILLLPDAAGRSAVLAALLLLGAAMHHTRVHERPRDDLLALVGPGQPGDPPPLVRLEGRVLGPPESDAPRPGTLDALLDRFDAPTSRFSLRLDRRITESGPQHVSGRVFVYASGLGEDAPKAGERVRLVGLLYRPRPAMNPGQGDPVAWANQSGRSGWVRTNAGSIERLASRGVLDTAAGWPPMVLAHLHAGAAESLREGTADATPASDILGAMLLGERPPDGRQQAAFARTGVAHLLAISGFHLAVLVALTVGVVRLTGDRPRAEAVVGLIVIALYLAVVPARTPIVRAGLLAGALLVAHFFARRWDRLALLGWIAALLLAWRPLDLFTLGYQLTVGVTALLLWLGDVRHPWVTGGSKRIDLKPERTVAGTMGRRLRSLAVTSVIVWLTAAPAILFHTGSFNPLTPLAVIVATPIATLVQVLGFAGLIAGTLSGGLGVWLMQAAEWAAAALAASAGVFDRVPIRTTLAPVSVAWAIAAVGMVVFALRRARPLDPRPWAALAAIVAWLVIEQAFSAGLPRRVAARVDMLSVGDGSCLLIRAGDDALLWDSGSLTPGIGVRDIPRAVRALGSPRVPVAVITHANIDHYAALPDAAPAIGLRRVYVSAPALETMRLAPDGSAEALFLNAMRTLGVEVGPIAQGDTIGLGPATLHAIWPPADPPSIIRVRNDRSVVARLDVPTRSGTKSALLTGDIQRPAMLMLLADAGERSVRADILELPHHGSHHDAAERFVAAVGPSEVLQSTGPSRLADRRWGGLRRAVADSFGAWRITARDGACWAEILDSGEIRGGSVWGGR